MLAGAGAVAAAPATTQVQPKTRQCIWFDSGGQFCCGMIHRPADATGKCPAVLMMHGLVGSKDTPHRMFVTLADALAYAGFVSLRFDLRGRGDSEGLSIDATPQRDLEDARAALKLLGDQHDVDARDLMVLGLSWGGVLAAHLAGESTAVKRVVLWSSCPADNEQWKPALQEIDGRQVSDVFGNLLSKDFYDGVTEMTPLSQLKRNRQPLLMVWGTRDEVIRQSRFEASKADLSFADVPVTLVSVDGADHAFMSHAAERKAIDETVRWLQQGR